MINSGDLSLRVSRTRRHALKMGGIVATTAVAMLANSKPGIAQNNQGGNNQGGNGQGGNNQGGDGQGGDGHGGNGQGGNGQGGNGHGANCMLKGTAVATAHGQRRVEELAIGDLMPTVYGGMRPVQWIGRSLLRKGDPSRPWPRALQPIHIVPSAIGPGVPHSDLYLSAEHALLMDGVLVSVGSLVNEVTIRRFDATEYDELEYFHVKVEGHDVIYAEGLPVETMLEANEGFVNLDEYVYLYGEPCEATRCAPFVSCTGVRREFRSRARSAMAPWIDRRQQVDLIRDRLEERAFSQELESA